MAYRQVQYRPGQRVWLKEFDNGESVQPRERAVVLGPSGSGLIVEVGRQDRFDDGLREIECDQVEEDSTW